VVVDLVRWSPDTSRQTRWMEYLARFDFDIRYTKGTLNKVADALSQYFEHDYWTEVPELQDYVNADVRLDPEHNDLPQERLIEVQEGIIETRIERAHVEKVQTELRALREHIQDRDALAAQIAAGQQEDRAAAQDTLSNEDPTVFKSRARGDDLHEFMSHDDTFEEDIHKGYPDDRVFGKILLRVSV
jgi:hypothetical protein